MKKLKKEAMYIPVKDIFLAVQGRILGTSNIST
jgi:hypothetical protein